METTEKQIDEKEALKVLSETISVAKGNLDDGYFYFVLWGCIGALVALSDYCLIKLNLRDYTGYGNVLYPVGGIISLLFSKQQNKKQKVNTYIEKWIGYVWIAFAIQATLLFNFLSMSKELISIVPAFLVLMGGATFMSGILVKFRPLIIGGIFFWGFSVAAFIFSSETQYLIAGIAMIIGNVIPGLIYRPIYKKENV